MLWLPKYWIVEADTNHSEVTHKLSGILDFGDIQNNYYLFEVSIAICYMMLECTSMNFLDAPGHVLAGYNSLRPIPDKEFELLKVWSLNFP